MSSTTAATTDVYMTGDPAPLETTLTIPEILDALLNLHELAADDPTALVFLRLPLTDGRDPAMVRPTAIAALVPVGPDED